MLYKNLKIWQIKFNLSCREKKLSDDIIILSLLYIYLHFYDKLKK